MCCCIYDSLIFCRTSIERNSTKYLRLRHIIGIFAVDNLQHELQRQSLINIPRKKKTSEKRKGRNDTYLKRLTPFCIYFQLIINLPHLLSLLHPSCYYISCYHPFYISAPRPYSIPTPWVWVYYPPPPDSPLYLSLIHI